MFTHSCLPTYIHTWTHKDTHRHTRAHMCAHTYTHRFMHTDIHTHNHSRTRTTHSLYMLIFILIFIISWCLASKVWKYATHRLFVQFSKVHYILIFYGIFTWTLTFEEKNCWKFSCIYARWCLRRRSCVRVSRSLLLTLDLFRHLLGRTWTILYVPPGMQTRGNE